MAAKRWPLTKSRKPFFGLSLLGLPLLVACEPPHTSVDTTLSASEVTDFVLLDERFALPKGARNVRVSYVRFQDTVLWVRFEASLETALGFASDYVGTTGIANCQSGTFKNVGPDWWPDHCVEGAKFGNVNDSSNQLPRQIMVVPKDEVAIVYIYTFTT